MSVTIGAVEALVPGRPASREPYPPEALPRAARAFEGLLWQQLLRVMRRAQLHEGFFGQGPGTAIYEGWFEQLLSERLAEGGSLGIADALLRQWGQEEDPVAELERWREARGRERAIRGFAQVADEADDRWGGGSEPAQNSEPLQGGRHED